MDKHASAVGPHSWLPHSQALFAIWHLAAVDRSTSWSPTAGGSSVLSGSTSFPNIGVPAPVHAVPLRRCSTQDRHLRGSFRVVLCCRGRRGSAAVVGTARAGTANRRRSWLHHRGLGDWHLPARVLCAVGAYGTQGKHTPDCCDSPVHTIALPRIRQLPAGCLLLQLRAAVCSPLRLTSSRRAISFPISTPTAATS